MITPPFIVKLYETFSHDQWFTGNYSSWDEAQRKTTGYDSDIIVNKVKESLLKVKEGKVVYERDSVLFDKIHYSFPLLSGLLRAAVENNGCLSVLDFGGSLGSSYYQNKGFLSGIKNLHWSIVEQEKFVNAGKAFFEDDSLKFYFSIDECFIHEKPDVILLSSVIQYINKPYELLSKIITKQIKYIIIDRTPFFEKHPDQLTIQKVPKEIYDASYPAWFFNEQKFIGTITKKYTLIVKDHSFHGEVNIGTTPAVYKTMIFKIKEDSIDLK